jgi:hypothetical protein
MTDSPNLELVRSICGQRPPSKNSIRPKMIERVRPYAEVGAAGAAAERLAEGRG